MGQAAARSRHGTLMLAARVCQRVHRNASQASCRTILAFTGGSSSFFFQPKSNGQLYFWQCLNLSPLKWIRWPGFSDIQTSVSHAISADHFLNIHHFSIFTTHIIAMSLLDFFFRTHHKRAMRHVRLGVFFAAKDNKFGFNL